MYKGKFTVIKASCLKEWGIMIILCSVGYQAFSAFTFQLEN